MSDSTPQEVRDALVAVLDEAFSKPSPDWRYFTDPSEDSGYFGVLAGLAHEQAAQSVGGSSIAAQVQNVALVLRGSRDLIEGNPDTPDLEEWLDSWQVSQLDVESWHGLVASLRNAYEGLRNAMLGCDVSRSPAVGNAIGAIAHVAYHLGAIKQKSNIIRSA